MNELETLEALQKLVEHIERNSWEHLYEKTKMHIPVLREIKKRIDKMDGYFMDLSDYITDTITE